MAQVVKRRKVDSTGRKIPVDLDDFTPLPGMSEEAFRAIAGKIELTEDQRRDLTMREWQIYVLRMSSEPPLSLEEVSRVSGLGSGSVHGMWPKIRKKMNVASLASRGDEYVVDALLPNGELKPQMLDQKINQALWMALRKVTDTKALEKATYDHAARAARNFFEMRQMRRGEPTQIVRHDQIPQMEKVGRQLMGALLRDGLEFRGIDPRTGEAIIEKNISPEKED